VQRGINKGFGDESEVRRSDGQIEAFPRRDPRLLVGMVDVDAQVVVPVAIHGPLGRNGERALVKLDVSRPLGGRIGLRGLNRAEGGGQAQLPYGLRLELQLVDDLSRTLVRVSPNRITVPTESRGREPVYRPIVLGCRDKALEVVTFRLVRERAGARYTGTDCELHAADSRVVLTEFGPVGRSGRES
jgi:hypothetical protein